MTIKNVEELVHAWIALQSADPESDLYGLNEWAANQLNMMCIEEPSAAFDVAIKIYEASGDPWIYENLGAWPIETLLAHEGKAIIPMLDAYIERQGRFRQVLGYVWSQALPDDVAAHLDTIVGRS